MKKWKAGLLAAVLAAGMMVSVCCAEEKETEKAMDVSGQVASADEMAPAQDVVDEDMVAVYGDSIKDGVYDITVDSSSSMFRIVDCQLTVEAGEMTAVLTMSSDGYLKLFMGTGEEAVAAPEDEYIPFVENEDGAQTYEVPVEALDMGIDCAAFSKRKEKWYDRVLVFRSDSLPQDAFAESMVTTVEDLALEDGSYQVEVSLEGGSGKVEVASPTALTVKDGAATATIIWSSPFYDYMVVDGEKLLPVATDDESSAYEIPVAGFDRKISAIADTIAMSVPHEIEYTLTFDSATIEKVK